MRKLFSDTIVDEILGYPGEKKLFIDFTYGSGFHSLLASRFFEKVQSYDVSSHAVEAFESERNAKNVTLNVKNILNIGDIAFDMAIADLGYDVSHFRLRGDHGEMSCFSDGFDLRIDKSVSHLTGSFIVNKFTGSELYQLFRGLLSTGQEKRVTNAIVSRRRNKQFRSSKEFVEFCGGVSCKGLKKNKCFIKEGARYLNAVRMIVNKELDVIKKICFLLTCNKDATLLVVSFNSCERRFLSHFCRTMGIKIVKKYNSKDLDFAKMFVLKNV